MKEIFKKAIMLISPRYQKLFLDYKINMQPRYGHGKPPHKKLYDIINQHREGYKSFLKLILRYRKFILDIKDIKLETDSTQPVWNNGFLPGLDMIALYVMISEIKPTKYIEIGSGNSTKVVYKAKCDQNLNTEIISIDPQPRLEIDNLADKIIREPFEKINYGFIQDLSENDILFIDNSHRILPNSDVMVFFMEVFPQLKKGVIVQIHDIYLPYDYPKFMCDRSYSEQYGLAFYLLANPQRYKPMLPNFFISEDNELSSILAPLWSSENLKAVEKHGGSFWVRIDA